MLTDGWTWIEGLPPAFVYLALGLGAGLENVIPAIPADTFVLLGGFLTAVREGVQARWVFLATWVGNVVSALAMYRLAYTHGPAFFERGWGRRFLNPRQMERMRHFYVRFGPVAIFFTRFLPGLRSVVPVFAGVSKQPLRSVAAPVIAASGIWYGALVLAGAMAGRNLDTVRKAFAEVNLVLIVAAVVATLTIGVWWWRTRGHELDG